MEEKKFYKEIQQKIDQTDFEPEWNRSEVWQRIEQGNSKKKPLFTWWKAAAASIALLGVFGAYFLKNIKQTTDYQLVTNNEVISKPQAIIPISTKLTQKVFAKTKVISQSFNEKKAIGELPQIAVEMAIVEPKIIEKTLTEKPAIAVNEEKVITPNEPLFSEKSTTFIANPAILEVKIPKKKERIAILEIPEDDETYTIQKKEKRKGYAARLARKMGKFNTQENEELPSINGKPNKVWAFVKESFKNETMVADSTVK